MYVCFSLEVSLEKEREGEWDHLLTGEGEGERCGIPLRGPVLSSEELETLEKNIAMATNEVKYIHLPQLRYF